MYIQLKRISNFVSTVRIYSGRFYEFFLFHNFQHKKKLPEIKTFSHVLTHLYQKQSKKIYLKIL